MNRLPTRQAEQRVYGRDIGLPLVHSIGAIRSHSAARLIWHAHQPFELLCVLDGATAYELRDGNTIELTGGQFVVLPPRAVHRGLHNVRMPAKLCGVIFDPCRPSAARHTPFTRSDLRWIARHFQAHSLTVCRIGGELQRLVTALNQQITQFDERTEEAALSSLRLLVCAVILEAARQLTTAKTPPSQDAVAVATSYLQEHFHEPVMMNDLAHRAGCSRARLFALFKQQTGLTPNDYLLRLRVDKARQLLTTTSRSVTEIAFEVGFASSQYFSRVFRKYTGQMPSEYRHRHKVLLSPRFNVNAVTRSP